MTENRLRPVVTGLCIWLFLLYCALLECGNLAGAVCLFLAIVGVLLCIVTEDLR